MSRARRFVSVDEVEQTHGPLLALDRKIAFTTSISGCRPASAAAGCTCPRA
jgi:hypothetical protein